MKMAIDTEADALYMRLSDTQIRDTEEVKRGIILDYDAKNNLVGIEILRVSKRVPASYPEIGSIESA